MKSKRENWENFISFVIKIVIKIKFKTVENQENK